MSDYSCRQQAAGFRSISRRFNYALIGIVSLILVSFAACATALNIGRITAELESKLSSYLRISQVSLAAPLWNLDNVAVKGFVASLFVDPAVIYARVVSDGDVVADQAREAFSERDFAFFSASAQFFSSAVEIAHNGETIGLLQLAVSRASVRREMLISTLATLGLVALVISAIAVTSLRVSRRYVAQPLKRLQRSAAAISGGDLDAAIELGRHDEIGALARILDSMRGSIKGLIGELRVANDKLAEYNRTLEQRVDERTAQLTRANAEISKARQHLVDAIESINEGFAFYDADDRLVLSNTRYRELLYENGTGTIDLSPGTRFADILRSVIDGGLIEDVGPDRQEWIERRMEQHRNPGPPSIQRRRGGRWIMVSEHRVSGGGTVAVFTDLTELKRSEAELTESRARLQAILDHAPLLVFVKDLEGRYVLSNRAFDEYRPHPAGSVVGKTDKELYTPEQAQQFRASDLEVLASGTAIRFEDTLWLDGERRTNVVNKFPLVDQHGEIYAICGIVSDVTEMKQREEKLQRTTERLQLALSMDGIGIWDVDLLRGEVWWSQKYTMMMGYDTDFRPSATTWEEHLHPDNAARIIDLVNDFLAGEEEVLRLTERVRRADGSDMWVDALMRVQRDAAGTAVRLSGLDVDTTEQLQRERRLHEANRQIMESIRYASRIQAALLPARDSLAAISDDYFLIWEPRDLVGGDFFWLHPSRYGVVVVVGDCTGHGVPGAFMTLIACGLLDRILQTTPPQRPGEILSKLHRQLQSLLGQDRKHGDTDDGLEAGVCFIDAAEKRLRFAGARFSLWRARAGAADELRGDRAGVGYRRYAIDTVFRDTELEIADGDALYMTTDGLLEQIGGRNRRSFGKKRFRAFLDEHHRDPMRQQAERLSAVFAAYQGDEIRRDDVTVLGFAVP